ncbi:MAG: PaaI family thioesterase, partial [Desulfovibrionaceae bacterium]
MPRDYLQAVREPGQSVNPLFSLMGMELLEAENGRATLLLPFQPGLVQGGGVVAGGVLAMLLDEVMAHAALSHQAETGRGKVATVNLNVQFLSPAKPGADILARAQMVRGGKR